MDTSEGHSLLQLLLHKTCEGVVCKLFNLHLAQEGQNVVVKNLLIVGICAFFHGITDMGFPLYAYGTDLVIMGRCRGLPAVQIKIRIFGYDLVFLSFTSV